MAINNTTDRTTFGPGADAIYAYEESARNRATLTTFGDRANGVFAFGERLLIENDGEIRTNGTNASGILVIGPDAEVVNRGDILTTGGSFGLNGSDGMVVTGNRFNMVNYGDITIAGFAGIAMAGYGNGGFVENAGTIDARPFVGPAMRLSGNDGTALNTGTIFVAGSVAIGAPGGANNALINRGRIEVERAGSSAVVGLSINVSTNARLVNDEGVIVANGVDAWGITGIGTGLLLENSGRIEATGTGALGLGAGPGFFGLRATTDARLVNSGTIRTTGDGSIGLLAIGDGAEITNFGRVEVEGGVRIGGHLGTTAASAVIASGAGVSVLNEAGGRLVSVGEAAPAVQLNVLGGAQTAPAESAATLENRGRIEADAFAVLGGAGEEDVFNFGRIIGDVDLGNGADSYTAGRSGRLDGALTLGAGDDLAVLERGFGKLLIADFRAGAGGEDEIDLSAWGFGSFGAVLARADERDGGVVINLGGGDRLTLEGVALASLQSGDFVIV